MAGTLFVIHFLICLFVCVYSGGADRGSGGGDTFCDSLLVCLFLLWVFCLFAFTVELPTGEGVAGTLSVIHDWGQRFEGQIDFPVKDDVEGWMANITFSAPVTKMDVSLLR